MRCKNCYKKKEVEKQGFFKKETEYSYYEMSEAKRTKLKNLSKIATVYVLSTVFAQNKQKRSKGFINVRDINQGNKCFVLFYP